MHDHAVPHAWVHEGEGMSVIVRGHASHTGPMKQLCQRRCILRMRILLLALLGSTLLAEIPRPDDAPQPLSPAESVKLFQLPAGYKISLLASEPLITDRVPPVDSISDAKVKVRIGALPGTSFQSTRA